MPLNPKERALKDQGLVWINKFRQRQLRRHDHQRLEFALYFHPGLVV